MKLSKNQQRTALMPLIELALEHLPALPPPQRADIYEGIHLVTRHIDRKLSDQARLTCHLIREAESSQLNFRELLMQPT